MRAIPGELEDAAVIDGCSRLGFFWRILMPLSPAGADRRSAILAFVTQLERLPAAAAGAQRPDRVHAAAGRRRRSSPSTAQDTARILAFTALSMVPALGFFMVAERRIVGGLPARSRAESPRQ